MKEITLAEPVITQLMGLPAGVDIIALAPEDMDVTDRNAFLVGVQQGILSYLITMKTYGEFSPQWIANSLTNRDRFIACKPVDQLKRRLGSDFAVVVGGAPSLRPENIPNNAEIYCCWNAAQKLLDAGVQPDIVGHVDPNSRSGYATDFGPFARLIATPQADPKFLECEGGLYGYFDPCNPANAWFAAHHGCGDHQHIVGLVSNMLVNAAIYAGHKTIALMGCDFAWTEGEYDSAKGCEITELVNRHGIPIKTYHVFQICAQGLWATRNYYPDVKIYQTSETALDVQGVEYRPIEAICPTLL